MQIRHYLSTDRMIRFSQRAALMGFALIAVQSAQAAPICAPAAGARSVPACMAEVNSKSPACPVAEQSATGSCPADSIPGPLPPPPPRGSASTSFLSPRFWRSRTRKSSPTRRFEAHGPGKITSGSPAPGRLLRGQGRLRSRRGPRVSADDPQLQRQHSRQIRQVRHRHRESLPLYGAAAKAARRKNAHPPEAARADGLASRTVSTGRNKHRRSTSFGLLSTDHWPLSLPRPRQQSRVSASLPAPLPPSSPARPAVHGQIRIHSRGPHELRACGPYRGLILQPHRLRRSPPLQRVALHPPLEAQLIGRVHIDAQLIERNSSG